MVAQERDKSAFPLYREAIAKKTGVADAHEALARIYERSAHADWAAAERKKAKGVPPPGCRTPTLECEFLAARHVKVLETARPLATAASRYWTSRAAGELARERSPVSSPCLLARGVLVRDVMRASGAISSRRGAAEAVRGWPKDRRLAGAGDLHFIAREYAEARPLLEELLKREPHSVELNLLPGEAWLESKEPAKPSSSSRRR
jgi:hypothetical protein